MDEIVRFPVAVIEETAPESRGELGNFFDPSVTFDVVPLTSEQRNLMGKSSLFLVECSEKVDRYLKENHDYFRLYGIPAMGAAIGVGTGAMVGTFIGSSMGPLGLAAGGITGGITGGVLGYFLTKAAVNMNVRSSDPFLEHCADDGMAIIEEYRDFLEEAEGGKYNDFMCPITRDFINIPVGHPGHKTVYEKVAIERYLKEYAETHPESLNDPDHINSPVKEPGRMDIENLRYDFTYLSRLIKMLSLDADEVFRRNMDSAIGRGIETLKKSKEETIIQMVIEVSRLYFSKQLPKKDYDAAIKFLEQEQGLLSSL